ncbi:MAG: pyruvate kinase [Gammaproteobacteria bacterium]|nr:pyruvate kinase [Gammaproteobacteria bacterium]
MDRGTKILATLGPATSSEDALAELVEAGVDLVRINFSHGDAETHRQVVERLRRQAALADREIGILADLQGPKIRIGRFADGPITLATGDAFTIDCARTAPGDQTVVGTSYTALAADVSAGDKLLLDDGRICMVVEQVEGSAVHCRVEIGGDLSNNKGLNRFGGGLSAPGLTEKDKADIKTAADLGVDYLAVSFVRSRDQIMQATALFRTAGGTGGMVAKIECAEVLDVIDEVIEACDAVMVARGDLGVEIGDAQLPAVQKMLIQKARNMDRAVITATQMMQSMVSSPVPTRAEVFDVANAVVDGTDAVMLSEESATGEYPAEAVRSMGRICHSAEQQIASGESGHRIESGQRRVDEAIASAAMYAARYLGVQSIVALTESGATALWMSRISTEIPIFALCRTPEVRGRMTLLRGVYPVAFDTTSSDVTRVNQEAISVLLGRGMVKENDLVLITKGDLMGVRSGTNSIKIIRVGDLVTSIY